MPMLHRRTEHPYRAKTLDELPAGLRLLAEQTLIPDDPADKIFIIPGQMLPRKIGGVMGLHWIPEQALLFTQRGVIHVQAGKSGDETGRANYLMGSSLLYAQMSMILLYGRLEICAAVNDEIARIVVEYNAVCHEMLEPSLHKLIHLAWDHARDQNANDHKTDLLGKLEEQSYKFRNGLAIHALQPDERLLGYVFQHRTYLHYFRIIHRLIAPASLMALTDKQLILIEEGMSSATSYGYCFTYCPRANVAAVDSKPNASLNELRVHFRKGTVAADHRLRMELANALACQNLWSSQAG
jgi:hypothetical protein